MEALFLSKKLQKEYNSVFSTRKRLERISNHSLVYLANRDLDSFYEGIFLKSITLFESFIEELFIGLLYDKYKFNTRKKVQKLIFPSKKIALNYLMNNKKYLDLLPYDRLKQNSTIFYNEDNPFSNLTKPDINFLNDIYILRNSIAHNSLTANKKFVKFINDKHPSLPISMKTPAKFLQSLNNPNQTMFEIYIIELNVIANKITSFT